MMCSSFGGAVNGVALMVPARLLEGLEEATDEQLQEVEFLGETGLRGEASTWISRLPA